MTRYQPKLRRYIPTMNEQICIYNILKIVLWEGGCTQLSGTKPEPILSPPAVPQEQLGTLPWKSRGFSPETRKLPMHKHPLLQTALDLWMWEEPSGVPSSDPQTWDCAWEVGGWEWGRRCQPGKVHR